MQIWFCRPSKFRHSSHTPHFAVRVRIKATTNVAKLTGVMKMVASAKARAAEEALVKGRPFGVSRLVYAWRSQLLKVRNLGPRR